MPLAPEPGGGRRRLRVWPRTGPGIESLIAWSVFGTTWLVGAALAHVWLWPVGDDWVLADAGQNFNPGLWTLQGAVPYRDFHYSWGPYAPLLQATALALHGVRESVLGLLTGTFLAVMAAGTYVYGRRLLSRPLAVVAALLAWVMLARNINLGWPNTYCTAFAIWALCIADGPASWRRALLAGGLGGIALAFKPFAGGTILATLWIVLFRPRPDAPLASRGRWVDPLWPCLLAYPLVVLYLTRAADASVRVWFPVATLAGLAPLAWSAMRTSRAQTTGTSLAARWGIALVFLGGVALVQTGWMAYYFQHVSPSELIEVLVLRPLEWGPKQLPFPPPLPRLSTALMLGALALSMLGTRRHSVQVGALVALILLAVWDAQVQVMHGNAGTDLYGNLIHEAPWVALVGVAVWAWPRTGAEPGVPAGLQPLAVALGTQAIICFPWSPGHFEYIAPFSALGLVWLAAKGWPGAGALVDRPPKWAWVRVAVVCAAVAFVKVEAGSRAWRLAGRQEGGWPTAMQIAPPRADLWMPAVYGRPVQTVHAILRADPAVSTNRLLSFPVPYFYWLTDTRNPMYHDYFFPGMMNAATEMAELQRLTRNPPQIVAVRAEAANTDTVFTPVNLAVSAPRITRWLATNYRVWRTVRPFDIMLPREDPRVRTGRARPDPAAGHDDGPPQP